MEGGYTYVIWFFAIWLSLTLGQCSQSQANREIIKELREIKMEMIKK
jgi:hypothetical protein